MISLVKNYLGSSTAKDSLIMLAGAGLTTTLGFFLTIILARGLTPLELGLILTALTFTQLVSDMFELGINSAALNFISSSEGHERLVFLKTTFISKFVAAILVGGAVFLLAVPLSQIIFRSEVMVPFIQVSSLGVALMMFIGWEQTVLQAEKRFLTSVFLGTTFNILRVLGVLLLLTLGIFSPINAYIVLHIVLPLVAVYFFLRIGINFLKIAKKNLVYKKVFSFGLPVGAGFAMAAIYTKLDQILIFNILGEAEAGIYGLAFRIMSVILFAAAALNAAITPRFTSLHDDQFSAYFGKTLLAALGLAGLSVLLILAAPLILPLLFGDKFISSILPFQILSIGAIFFILSSPFYTAILYRLKKTKYSLVVAIISLVLIWGLLNFLIPLYGTLGAAIAVTSVYGLQLALSASFYLFWSTKVTKVS